MVYIDINKENWLKFVNEFVEKNDIYDVEGYGIETEPHVTVLYGLDDPNILDLKKLVERECLFPTIKITGISSFENEEFDVLKFSVEAPGLHNLNRLIRENFKYENKYNDYVPHITISYLKKGTAQKYLNQPSLEGDLNPKNFIYSYGERDNRQKQVLVDLDKYKNGSYFYRINNLISKADDGSNEAQERIKRQLSREFEQFSMQGKVTIGYRYCDREENRQRGRVGSFAGWRVTTRAYKYMPPNVIPETRSKNKTAVRYYDFGRADWRSYRKDYFVVMSSFWSEEKQEWVDTPEEAGFKRTWKNDNKKYKKDREFFDEELDKKKKAAKLKDIKKKKEQIEKQKKKMKSNKIEKSMNHKYLWKEFKDGEHIYHYNVLHPRERKTKQDERVDTHLDIGTISFDEAWELYRNSIKSVIFAVSSKYEDKRQVILYYYPDKQVWMRGRNKGDREEISPEELKRIFNVHKKGESELVLKNVNYKEGELEKINDDIREYYEQRISDYLKELETHRNNEGNEWQ